MSRKVLSSGGSGHCINPWCSVCAVTGLLGNTSDTGKRKKDKRRSGRKKRGHLRQQSEDLNNNNPGAKVSSFAESADSSTAPTHRRRRSTGVAGMTIDIICLLFFIVYFAFKPSQCNFR